MIPTMEWLLHVVEQPGFWAVTGAVVGTIAGFFLSGYREWRKQKAISRALLHELNTNLHLINDKKLIITQILTALGQGRLLPGASVHAATMVYDSYISTIYTSLKPKERENLHVIYQHLKLNDSFLDAFEKDYKADLKLGTFKNQWESTDAYKTRFTDISDDYTMLQGLIKDYLDRKPREVFRRPQPK